MEASLSRDGYSSDHAVLKSFNATCKGSSLFSVEGGNEFKVGQHRERLVAALRTNPSKGLKGCHAVGRSGDVVG